jgi:hypothetical protein
MHHSNTIIYFFDTDNILLVGTSWPDFYAFVKEVLPHSSLSCFASERGWLQSLLNCVTSNTAFPVFVSATTAVLDLAAVGLSFNVTREESGVSSVIIKPLITAHDFQKIRNSGLIQS